MEAATDLSDKPIRKPLTAEQEAKRKERDKQMGDPGLKAGWSTGGDDQHGDSVSIRQVLAIKTKKGKRFDAMQTAYKTAVQHYAVVDDFIQKTFKSPFTGQPLPYNLFLPKNYDPQKKYPLVLFIHDAGVASSAVNTPLLQGRGAVTWATADFQAKHPCIVVAPEFPVVTVDDNWNYSHHLDATIALVKNLSQEYAVDTSRIYTTGQSMGCMSSMVLLLKEPNLFAGALLVAGKWEPSILKPLAKQNLWIISCEGDASSTELQDKAVELWRNNGMQVNEATWNMTSNAKEFDEAFKKQVDPNVHLYFTHLMGGSHRGTWAVAYDIDGVKEWLFSQQRK